MSPIDADSFHSSLADSIVDGNFIDVRFYFYSRRLCSGRVGVPRAVYANGAVLKAACPYFEGLLAAGFAESGAGKLSTGLLPDQPSFTDAYGFECDSDLDDDDDVHDSLGDTSSTASAQGQASETTPSDGGTLSSRDTLLTPHESQSMPDSDSSMSRAVDPELSAGSRLRTILIPDVALTTWQSLVFYIYTGKIAFAPLQSQGLQKRAIEQREYRQDHPRHPPLCSPKSMYRLADKLGIDELKTKALADIRAKLSTVNIVDELFSSFTIQHTQILDAQRDFFCEKCLKSDIIPILGQKLEDISSGQLPHAGTVLMSLFGAWITQYEHWKTNPTPMSSPPPSFMSPPPPSFGFPSVVIQPIRSPARGPHI